VNSAVPLGASKGTAWIFLKPCALSFGAHFVSNTFRSMFFQPPTPNFQLDESFPSKKMRESENMFKSGPGSKQRSMNIDDGGQPGSASWISIRSESTLVSY